MVFIRSFVYLFSGFFQAEKLVLDWG